MLLGTVMYKYLFKLLLSSLQHYHIFPKITAAPYPILFGFFSGFHILSSAAVFNQIFLIISTFNLYSEMLQLLSIVEQLGVIQGELCSFTWLVSQVRGNHSFTDQLLCA